jgi:hypothetical protein
MPDFNLALAPARLTQTINPWTFNLGSLFTINLGDSGDPALESRMLDKAGSYGRQIGRLGDVLGILLAQAEKRGELAGLSKHDLGKIEDFRRQLERVEELKADRERELRSAPASSTTASSSH